MKEFPRIIKNGKLDIVATLKGGPGDGLLVINDLDVIRLPGMGVLPSRVNWVGLILPPYLRKYHEYMRISTQTFIYIGVKP